jgi:hypothetical protein
VKVDNQPTYHKFNPCISSVALNIDLRLGGKSARTWTCRVGYAGAASA